MAPPSPTASANAAAAATAAAAGRHDELFLSLAQQHSSIESLLDSFFDFLHRKTDFYVVTADPAGRRMGFRRGDAQRKVLEAFARYPLRDVDAEPAEPLAPARPTPKPRKKETPPPVKLTDKGKQLPIGNGGVTERYSWTQTLEDVTVLVPVPEGTSAKDIACDLHPQRVRVSVRARGNSAAAVLLDGEFPERIRADESLWSLENGATLQLSLEKVRKTWWASVLRGDAEIDTSEVDSTRQISEYDEVTQGAIRKAMFDQRQRQLGLPTSEELATEQLLAQARQAPNCPI
ncbi:hypothetical protein ATCC90586_009826 [Pythium insidiosum]|nr:hypothetical protein ATCC90586_009826 [Pythium insidiosum]